MRKLLIGLFALVTITVTAASIWTATKVVGDTSRVASRLIWSKPAKLFAVMGYNAQTNSQFVFIFESGSTPTNGQAGKLGPFPIGAAQGYYVDLSAYGADLDAITVGISTSDTTFTNSATNCTIQAIIVPNQ